MKEHRIDHIMPGSIAEEMEIEPNDVLLSINGQEVLDVLDYHYLTNEEYLMVVIRKSCGEEWELEIEKEYEDDLGIEFENGLMDDYKSCCNRCIFCFIDQMPKGMRDTLYFKDDDSRLSFLQGNYITLTNLKERDLERIIAYKLGPINVSVHTTNPELRCKMLNNRFAGEALKNMDRLFEAGISMNGQIVLCKGVNDGAELERSIQDLMRYLPVMESVSVVPVGLSKYREGLYPLQPFTKADAAEVLAMIHKWQQVCYETYGLHFIHASDEWYLLAGQELPKEESYDGYPQLENGVGMLRLLETEFMEALREAGNTLCTLERKNTETSCSLERKNTEMLCSPEKRNVEMPCSPERKDTEMPCSSEAEGSVRHTISVATGLLAAPQIRKLTDAFQKVFPQQRILVYPIENRFFGEMITVSGLLTGQDILAQLKGKELGERLLLPCNLLRSGEAVFLDDVTLAEMKKALQVPINIVESNGHHFVECLLK